jgi:hypothetical protein
MLCSTVCSHALVEFYVTLLSQTVTLGGRLAREPRHAAAGVGWSQNRQLLCRQPVDITSRQALQTGIRSAASGKGHHLQNIGDWDPVSCIW